MTTRGGEDNVFAKVDKGEKVKTGKLKQRKSKMKSNYWDALPPKCNIIKTQNNKLWSLKAVNPGYAEARQIYQTFKLHENNILGQRCKLRRQEVGQ